jgi:hypothetical protein
MISAVCLGRALPDAMFRRLGSSCPETAAGAATTGPADDDLLLRTWPAING